MYLILFPESENSYNDLEPDEEIVTFDSFFTCSKIKAYEALKKEGVKVYKLDNLQEVNNIELTFQESIKELAQ